MKIWKQEFSLEGMNAMSQNTMVETLGIEFIEIGEDYLKAKMPVNTNTVQPMRILHGGASVALAETIGSVASLCCLTDVSTYQVVGLDINANHLKSVVEGSFVVGTAQPIHLGKKTHVWKIEIHDERHKLVCISRLTMMVRAVRVP
ncbi:MAG: hotdog fold thioesterase [Aureispira sp.]|nr:hotdog fold thioesterase [Aureispira sp.]